MLTVIYLTTLSFTDFLSSRKTNYRPFPRVESPLQLDYRLTVPPSVPFTVPRLTKSFSLVSCCSGPLSWYKQYWLFVFRPVTSTLSHYLLSRRPLLRPLCQSPWFHSGPLGTISLLRDFLKSSPYSNRLNSTKVQGKGEGRRRDGFPLIDNTIGQLTTNRRYN